MIPIHRPAFLAFVAFVIAGCQTASLEDAAPKAAVVSASDGAAAPATLADGPAAGSSASPEPAAAEATATAPTVIRRNPGFTSVVPIEKTTPVENKEFVTAGAKQTGEYPKFGNLPQAANTQMTNAEKLAAEAEMAELLRTRAATPSARAQYEARLKQLRALAANHGADTQRQIEK